jgi:hypothetical protein
MGGSGGSGGFSSGDMSKIQAAAEERLRALASKSTKILFLCEAVDKSALESLLSKSTVFSNERVIVVDSGEAVKLDGALDGISFFVCFTDTATSTSFIDAAIDKAMAKKIGGVHVKAKSKSIIPSKISAYRMRSVTWRELETIFK